MCWRTVLLEDVSVSTAIAPVNASVQYHDDMKRSSHILSENFKVDLAALLTEQNGQNDPKTTN